MFQVHAPPYVLESHMLDQPFLVPTNKGLEQTHNSVQVGDTAEVVSGTYSGLSRTGSNTATHCLTSSCHCQPQVSELLTAIKCPHPFSQPELQCQAWRCCYGSLR